LDTLKFSLFIIYKYVVFVSFFVVVVLNPFLLNSHPTEDTDRPYPEGFHQMRQPPNNRKSKEKTDRPTSERSQQRQTREYQNS
jgi:hypothetical protein